jgi:hypothetical protein
MNEMVGPCLPMAMEPPVVYFEMINELDMSIGILNPPMRLKESFNAIGIYLGLHSGAYVVIETRQT